MAHVGAEALQRQRAALAAGAVKVGNLRTRRGVLSTLQSVATAKSLGLISHHDSDAWSRLLGRALQALDLQLAQREELLAEANAKADAEAGA